MKFGRRAVCVMMGMVAACTPVDPLPSSPSPSASASGTTLPSSTPSPTPMDDQHLPYSLPVAGSLLESDNAKYVVQALHQVAEERPVLKLDITVTDATLTVLSEQQHALSFRWANGLIDAATTDFQYLGQSTFNPDDYPLERVGLMFDLADLMGVTGDLVYQVQEYREQQVLQTVSSMPESTTVFFRDDASAVPDLDVNTASDVAAGLESVVGDSQAITQFGYSAERGYWAIIPGEGGSTLRTRKDGIPMFEAPDDDLGIEHQAFDPNEIVPAVLVQAVTGAQGDTDQSCQVTVEVRSGWNEASATIHCGTKTVVTDLSGKDITGDEPPS